MKTYENFKKPAPKQEPKLDYDDMMDYLEKKYNFESRGFTGIPSTMNYDSHAEYKNADDGKKAKPPYMDFWHYLVDQNDGLGNGSFIYIPKVVPKVDRTTDDNIDMYKQLLNMYPNDKEIKKNVDILIKREEEEKKNPKVDPWKGWRQQITDLIFKEFGEYSDGDSLKVWVEW